MTNKNIRHLQDGRGNNVNFQGIPVYYYNINGKIKKTALKNKIDKTRWVLDKIVNKNKANAVLIMLKNWDLYKEGWLFTCYDNVKLFYYLAQIGDSYRPEELDYFN